MVSKGWMTLEWRTAATSHMASVIHWKPSRSIEILLHLQRFNNFNLQVFWNESKARVTIYLFISKHHVKRLSTSFPSRLCSIGGYFVQRAAGQWRNRSWSQLEGHARVFRYVFVFIYFSYSLRSTSVVNYSGCGVKLSVIWWEYPWRLFLLKRKKILSRKWVLFHLFSLASAHRFFI